MTNNVEIIKLADHGSSLGPRELGKQIREKVEGFLKNERKVLFDFTGVHLISSAFADEIFGKLFVDLGEDMFKSEIKINGFGNEEEKKLILFIIQKGIDFRKNGKS